MPSVTTTLFCLIFAVAACKGGLPPEAGESASLLRAKAMVEQTAKDFEALAAQAEGAQANPEQLRGLGERLRKGLESHRSEGEALSKQLTDDEKKQLRAFGVQRLMPAVRALEAKLGTSAEQGPAGQAEPATATAR